MIGPVRIIITSWFGYFRCNKLHSSLLLTKALMTSADWAAVYAEVSEVGKWWWSESQLTALPCSGLGQPFQMLCFHLSFSFALVIVIILVHKIFTTLFVLLLPLSSFIWFFLTLVQHKMGSINKDMTWFQGVHILYNSSVTAQRL